MQIFCSVCMLFLIKSAPCRLSPNEALPQTPLGALPLDPTSPLAPGLSVRFISRFARCLGAALLIPHSSFLIPHLAPTPAVIMNITIRNISYSPNTSNIIPFALVLSHTVVPFSISYLFIAAVSFAS